MSEPDFKSRFFTFNELACKHCGAMRLSGRFIDHLDELRAAFGGPLIVTSAFRCALHPEEIRKIGGPGAHNTCAVDFAVRGEDAYRLIETAMKLDWAGIGVNQRGEKRFIHLDRAVSRESAPRPTVWSY